MADDDESDARAAVTRAKLLARSRKRAQRDRDWAALGSCHPCVLAFPIGRPTRISTVQGGYVAIYEHLRVMVTTYR